MLTLIQHAGLPALFFSILLETLGAPTPGESILIAMGAAAGDGKISLLGVVVFAWLAAVIGGSISYWLGIKLGRPVIVRYGSKVGLGEKQYSYTEGLMQRYGFFLVTFARFFIILRQLNGIVAGATEMHWATYTAANMLGATLWVGLWVILSAYFGHDLHKILPFFYHHLSIAACVIMVVLLLTLIWLYHRRGK